VKRSVIDPSTGVSSVARGRYYADLGEEIQISRYRIGRPPEERPTAARAL